mgnify:CR=1 FL=1
MTYLIDLYTRFIKIESTENLTLNAINSDISSAQSSLSPSPPISTNTTTIENRKRRDIIYWIF